MLKFSQTTQSGPASHIDVAESTYTPQRLGVSVTL
jgi:hypothetical protein